MIGLLCEWQVQAHRVGSLEQGSQVARLYLLRPGWRSEVLQVAARPRHLPAVLDHLFWHAASEGSAALRGRLEPGLLDAVTR